MAASDASGVPIRNQAYRVSFPILDADGDLVTGATGLDSEISKDGGTAIDVTAEATEVATSLGMYFLDLTATEMDADTVIVIIKTTSSGAKTTPIVLYPMSDGDIVAGLSAVAVDLIWDELLTGAAHNTPTSAGRRLREVSANIFNSGTAQAGGNNSITLATGAEAVNDFYNRARVIITEGTGAGQEAIITDYVGATRVASTTPAWTTNPDVTSVYEVLPGQVHTTVQNGGYDNGKVYFDSVNGTAGTVKGVNGTSTNPSSVAADAYAIMAQENIATLSVRPGSTLTLPSDTSNLTIEGDRYVLALNGQAISGATFRGANTLTGIGTVGAGVPPAFFLCGIGDVTLPPSAGFQCGFFGTLTIGSAGDFTFGGSSEVFNASLTVDYGAALNASQFFLTSWGGGSVEIQNAGAGTGGYTFEMNGHGDLVVNANCSATTAVILRGSIHLHSNAASGITFDTEANAVGTGGVILGQVDDVSPTVDEFNTDGFIQASNNHFNGSVLRFTDGALAGQSRIIITYTGSGQNFAFDRPWTEAPADDDSFEILQTAGVIDTWLARASDVEANTTVLNSRAAWWAAAKLTNKVASAGGVLTIFEDDDLTALFTQALTTDGAADPITVADTV